MLKGFHSWTILKEQIEFSEKKIYANKREIWWCSLGENVGTELCGKNELYERPVLVLKVFNAETIKILPLTSKKRVGKYYVDVSYQTKTSSGSLSQIKTISTKRLSRKIGKITQASFDIILQAYKNTLQNRIPPFLAVFSEPFGLMFII